LASTAIYFIHYLIFRDAHHIFLYLIGDIGFLFVDVLIVMLVLHRLLEYRDKRSVLNKLNMVIGTFFSEVGIELLKKSSHFDPELSSLAEKLMITKDWTQNEFVRARKYIKNHESEINSQTGNLQEIKDFLVSKRPFLLRLLENPNLLEHESFTEVLWAVFHLTDELAHRRDLAGLLDTDYQHLSGDIKRAYHQLILQWLDYMRHLKEAYPYLFSLAIRTNPFDENVSVEVK
jgi:hypothetical protein